ncbi:MAG: bifunctional serine/threonine-protein kinase/formylglycine-generating enzyme family protein [Planctomycetota bacterium]
MTTPGPNPLESLLIRRIETELGLPAGSLASVTAVLQALRDALQGPLPDEPSADHLSPGAPSPASPPPCEPSPEDLSPEGIRPDDKGTTPPRAEGGAASSLDELIANRIEKAMAAAVAAIPETIKPTRPLQMPRVVFLSAEEGAVDRGSVSRKLTQTLAAADMPSADAPAPDQPERTLIFADHSAYAQLRLDPTLPLEGRGVTLSFGGETPSAGDMEVIEVTASLEELGAHVTKQLAKSKRRRPRAEELVAKIIGEHYRVTREIGTGGFGSVYEAVDETLGTRVAIKILNPRATRRREDFEALKEEARRVTRLSHPHIVDWKVFGEMADGRCYFVMEYLAGEELEEILKREGTLPPRRVARLLLQILEALRYAHHLNQNESILHLDLKPSNIFVVPDPHNVEEDWVKVIDFGIGQYITREGTADLSTTSGNVAWDQASIDMSAESPGRTRACTPEYASPEQCTLILERGNAPPLDGRSDLYSLGVLGFQMLTGELPFDRPADRHYWPQIHLNRPPKRVRSTGKRVPRALAAFIDRCLIKERDKRWRDTNEACEALRRIVHPPAWRLAAAIAIPLVIVAVVVSALMSGREPPQPFNLFAKDAGPQVPLDVDHPLWLGPSRPEVPLTFDLALASGAEPSCTLVKREAEGDQVLEGWQVVVKDNSVVLRATTLPGARKDELVLLRVTTDGDDRYSVPFRLVYLPPDAVAIDPIQALDDPYHVACTKFEVHLSGKKEDIAGVRVSWEGSAEEKEYLSHLEPQGTGHLLSLPLHEWNLLDGLRKLTLEVTDRAGDRKTAPHSVRVEQHTLEFSSALLTNATARSDGSFVVYPGTVSQLVLTFNRDCDLNWRITDLNSRNELASGTGRTEAASYRADLTTLSECSPQAAYTATIEIEAHDSGVVHAPSCPEATRKSQLTVEYQPQEPELALYSASTTGSDSRMESDKPTFVNRGELALDVRKINTGIDPPVHLRVTCEPTWANATSGTVTVLEEDLRIGRRETRAAVALNEDGLYRVRVSTLLLDGTPVRTEDYDVIRDSREPEVALNVTQEGATHPVVRATGAGPRLTLTARDEPTQGVEQVQGGGAALRLRWWLLDQSVEGSRIELPPGTLQESARPGEAIESELPPVWQILPKPRRGTHDGLYYLEVQAEDSAGNLSAPVSGEFEIAREGPTIKSVRPFPGRAWDIDKATEKWRLYAEVEDPNKVAEVTCQVDAKDAEAQKLGDVRLSRMADDPSQWESFLRIPPSWSNKDVLLRWSATDLWGNKTPETPPQVTALPEIRPEPVLEVCLTGEPAIPCGRLIFIEGTGNAPFTLGPRSGDEDRLRQMGRSADHLRRWSVPIDCELDDFYMGELEVTRRQYRLFLDRADGYLETANWRGRDRPDTERLTQLRAVTEQDPDLPLTDITWDEALAYASWLGMRLPSFAEWNYAARGGHEYRLYPSLEPGTRIRAPAPEDVNYRAERAWPPGQGSDRSGHGIWNLGGNVSEWTESPVLNLVSGKEVDPFVLARDDERCRRALLEPHLEPPEAWFQGEEYERETYWVVGGNHERGGFDCFMMGLRSREKPDPDTGFRCAISASEVSRSLDPTAEASARVTFRTVAKPAGLEEE